MSRRIRVNLTRWVCRMIGHRYVTEHWPSMGASFTYCDRCERF